MVIHTLVRQFLHFSISPWNAGGVLWASERKYISFHFCFRFDEIGGPFAHHKQELLKFVGQKWIEWDDWSILHNSLSFYAFFGCNLSIALRWDQCNCVGGNKVTPNFVFTNINASRSFKATAIITPSPSWSIMNFAHQHGINCDLCQLLFDTWINNEMFAFCVRHRRFPDINILVEYGWARNIFATSRFHINLKRTRNINFCTRRFGVWIPCVLYLRTHRPNHISFTQCLPAVWWMPIEFAVPPADLAEALANQKL